MLPIFLLAATILLLAVFFTYKEALDAYFTCDDLWHMERLHQTFNGDFNKLFESFYGTYRLELSDTTAGAYHYLRLSALDKNGNILGTQSYPLGVLRGSCNKRSE